MTTRRIPARLPERAYLIAYDLERVKFRGGGTHAHLVRAAALVELFLAGQLEDEGGKAMATGRRTGDPVLDAVLAQIWASKPRSWKHWVNKDHKATYEAVRERLSADRMIKVEDTRLLGVLPRINVTLNDPRVVRELIAGSRDAVLGGTPVAQLDARVAALAGLVAAVELNTVFSGRERRDRRERIAQLATRAGPATKALRSVFVDQNADVPATGG
jgi:hypothetical protein